MGILDIELAVIFISILAFRDLSFTMGIFLNDLDIIFSNWESWDNTDDFGRGDHVYFG